VHFNFIYRFDLIFYHHWYMVYQRIKLTLNHPDEGKRIDPPRQANNPEGGNYEFA